METCLLQPKINALFSKHLLHIASSCCSSNSKQINSALKKVFNINKRRAFFYQESPPLSSSKLFNNGQEEIQKLPNSKRAAVLNKLFMRYITDLMSTGECSKQFLSHGIEISKVQVTSNYKMLKVYWIAKGNENDQVLEELLQQNSGLLRHELCQLRVIGVVPHIHFVKDKSYALVAEIDTRLAKADFGEDYERLDQVEKLKLELELLSSHSNKERLSNTPSEVKEENGNCDELPPMPQNVLGLDHAAILKHVVKNLNKNKRKLQPVGDITSPLPPLSINEAPVEYKSHQEQRAAFKEFLHKREISRNKTKSDKKYTFDKQYMDEESRDIFLRSLDNLNIEEHQDFIIEDNEDTNEKL